MATRVRLDRELVRRGLAPSREAASDAIRAGRVLVGGAVAAKPSALVSPADPLVLAGPARRWASRGGDKLAPALERLRVDVAGRRCLDAGASTGGFTDVLLDAGAAEVVAVDVGYGQLDLRLRQDPRVRVLDRTNVRSLDTERVGGPVDLMLLVKPQFEAGREAVGRGGVVRDPAARAAAVRAVADAGVPLGLGVAGLCPSPLPGPAGNLELFLHLRAGAPPLDEPALQAALAEGATLPGAAG